MQKTVADKILAPIGNLPAISHSICAFVNSATVSELYVVYRDEQQQQTILDAIKSCDLTALKINWICGGSQRQDSVYNALQAIPANIEIVFIHDCARPHITPWILNELLITAQQDATAVPAKPVVDTIKRISTHTDTRKCTLEDVPRNELWAIETPQVFKRDLINESYKYVKDQGITITDDSSAAAAAGYSVSIVKNPYPNPKITIPSDLDYLKHLFAQNQSGQKKK